jgi:hypothetical protein
MAKKIMQPPTKKPVNSDSLMNESNRKKSFAATQEKMGKASIKAGRGDESKLIDLKGNMSASGNERIVIAKKLRTEASKDSTAAVKGYPKAMPTKSSKKLVGTPIRKPTVKSNTNDIASNYRKLAKAQKDSSNQMGMKNNPMGKEVLKRSVKNTEKAIRAEQSTIKKK